MAQFLLTHSDIKVHTRGYLPPRESEYGSEYNIVQSALLTILPSRKVPLKILYAFTYITVYCLHPHISPRFTPIYSSLLHCTFIPQSPNL